MINLAIDLFRNPYHKDYTYDRHREVIKKLKFISKIEPGERINVNNVSTASNNWFTSIYRSIFKESRAKTFQFLNDIIDRSFELISLYQDSGKTSDRITCSQILEDLNTSVIGLRNLQTTYSDDRNFSCDIDTLIGSVFARLAEIYERNDVYMNEETRSRMKGWFPTREAKPEQNQEAKPEAKPEVKPVAKPEAKQEDKPDEAKQEDKPEDNRDKPKEEKHKKK